MKEGGVTYNKYLFIYRFDGADYSLDIPASSPAEAKERLSAMGMARYEGEIKLTIPVPGGGFLTRLFGGQHRW